MNTRTRESLSRLNGRLLVFVCAAFFVTGAEAAPVKTLVQDTLYRADGSAAQGNVTVRWNGFSTSAGEAVAAGQLTVKTDANGGISIPLLANTGSSPSGSYYRVVIKLDDGTTSEEMWVVPAATTTTVAAVRARVVPQAVAAQFVGRDYVDSGLATTVHLAGTETIQGVKTFVPSPVVPVPSAAGGAANKGYVDQAIAGLATVASTGSYNDLLNKPASTNLAAPGAIGSTTPGPVNATAYSVNGTPLTSGNLSDAASLARNNAVNTFAANQTILYSGADGVNPLLINATGSGLSNAFGVNLNLPSTGSHKAIGVVNGTDSAGWFSLTGNVDDTGNVGLEFGPGGAGARDTFLFRGGVETLTTPGSFTVQGDSTTVGNSNVFGYLYSPLGITTSDQLDIVDSGSSSTLSIELPSGGITGTRVVTLPDANSNTVQALSSGTAGDCLQYIDASGVQHLIPCSTGAAVSLLGYGAKCDGASDDSAAFTAADALGVSVLVPSGTAGACVIQSSIVLNSQYVIGQGAKLSPGSGVTVTMGQAPQAGLYQIFGGAGQVRFSGPVTVYPEWWGAVPSTYSLGALSVDSYPALVSACASLPYNHVTQALYSGANARQGAIRFRSMWYYMSHPWTCSYGVAYTNGIDTGQAALALDSGTGGQATLELAAGAVPSPPANEIFAFFVDPPAATLSGSTAVVANTAFGTRVKGIAVAIDGNTYSGGVYTTSNYVSGFFDAMAQGSSVENVSVGHAWGRGCVILSAPDSINKDQLDCVSTQNGPNVDIAGQGAFDFINVGNSNMNGMLGQVDLKIPSTSYTIPFASGVVSGSSRILVLNGTGGSGYNYGYANYPFRYMTKLTSGTPLQGQYVEGSGGVLTFNSSDVGAQVRVYYQDTGVITTANATVKPSPSIQIENATNLHVNELFCEGDYDCLNAWSTRGLIVDQLEAHPNAAVGTNAAAVYLDSKTGNVFMPNQKYQIASSTNKWGYGVDDQAHTVLRTLAADSVDVSYGYDNYSDGLIANGSTPGFSYPDGSSITVNANGQLTVPTATTSVTGLVKPDGTTVTISGGVISAAPAGSLPNATTANQIPVAAGVGNVYLAETLNTANFPGLTFSNQAQTFTAAQTIGALNTATSSNNYGSNNLLVSGSYYNSSNTPTACNWTVNETIGSGTTPTSDLNFTPSCGTGAQYVNLGAGRLISSGAVNISASVTAQEFIRAGNAGTVAVGAGAGTGGTAACVSGASCLNNGGRVLVTAGSSGMAAGTQATFTFINQFPAAPVCPVTINYNNSTTTGFLAPGWSATSSALTFTLGTALAAGQTVEFDYVCI